MVILVEVAVDHGSSVLLPLPLVVLRGRDSDLLPVSACAGINNGPCLGKSEPVDPVLPDSELVMDHWYRMRFGGREDLGGFLVDLPSEGTGIDPGCISAGVEGSDRLLRGCFGELPLLLASEAPLMKRRGLSMLDQVPPDFGPDAVVGLCCDEGDAVSVSG